MSELWGKIWYTVRGLWIWFEIEWYWWFYNDDGLYLWRDRLDDGFIFLEMIEWYWMFYFMNIIIGCVLFNNEIGK